MSRNQKFRDSTALFRLDCKSAVLSLNFWFLDDKNLGTVQHFCSPEGQKCCTVPNFFWFFIEKCCTVPKKPKKPILQNLQGLPSLKVLENRFFRFFRDSTALFNEKPKILGTVQHFCPSGLQKCCTVPKFLVPRRKNLGTVQHFCNPEEQKCCTVPKFLVPRRKKIRDSTALFCLWIAKLLYCP